MIQFIELKQTQYSPKENLYYTRYYIEQFPKRYVKVHKYTFLDYCCLNEWGIYCLVPIICEKAEMKIFYR